MIEGLVVLLMVCALGWLLLASLGFVVKLLFWMITGFVGLIGGAVLLAVLLPLGLILGIVLMPLILLAMLPAIMPMLLLAAVVYWLVREPRRPVGLPQR